MSTWHKPVAIFPALSDRSLLLSDVEQQKKKTYLGLQGKSLHIIVLCYKIYSFFVDQWKGLNNKDKAEVQML